MAFSLIFLLSFLLAQQPGIWETKIQDDGHFTLTENDVDLLIHRVRFHVTPDIEKYYGPGRWPRDEEHTLPQDWNFRIIQIYTSTGPPGHAFCETEPDSSAIAQATVAVEAIPVPRTTAPEMREARYWLTRDGRWKPKRGDTPCLSTWNSYYF